MTSEYVLESLFSKSKDALGMGGTRDGKLIGEGVASRKSLHKGICTGNTKTDSPEAPWRWKPWLWSTQCKETALGRLGALEEM